MASSEPYVEAEKREQAHEALHNDAEILPNDMTVEEAHAAMPFENQPTIGFIFPFPQYSGLPGEVVEDVQGKQASVPPFIIYHPPAARLTKPPEGEKESLVHKAQRKMEEEQDGARGKTGVKAKAVGLISKGMSATKSSGVEFLARTPNKKKLKEIRLLYPSAYPPDDLKMDFNKLIQQTKKSARKNSIIATSLAPFALAFDTLTFIPGPFEICTVWATSSWIGSSRAAMIANGVTSEKVSLNFAATDKLDPLTFRLHEIVAHRAAKGSATLPKWTGGGTPQRGPELANIILQLLQEQLGQDLSAYDTDKSRLAEDIEDILQKAAKEWTKDTKEYDEKMEKERKKSKK